MKKIIEPTGSQLLFFPMIQCTVSAGFKNSQYKKGHKYTHYGVDFDDRYGKDYDVIASGEGTVLGVEKNNNSIGGVVVIKYPKVYNPSTGKVQDLIVRYYHLYTIKVKKAQTVKAYDVLGTISGTHKYWNHIHYELDTDTKYPFHTPQVKESGSVLLINKGANDKTIINPMNVLVVGKKQTCVVHSLAVYADKVLDAPKYEEG